MKKWMHRNMVVAGEEPPFSPLLAVALIGISLWLLLAPRSAWWVAHGWHSDGLEPSDLAILVYRLSGVVGLVLGVLYAMGVYSL